ncbi:hypothetical protein KHA94_07890 [Bacillus sp. FJAT-49705]|uniref:Uncharacterized protein n=1 Tax=Cytobacillus citreus TaxID=2833586 RepID=A0ABS5NRM4_9BACI|nr:hypothetical protein [Cytobacillus citreus]MBS4190124.1 hypothetical protein [Cytobacillus citreus]
MNVAREKELENLVEALIRMLGKSNERVNDLNKRVNQLEVILRESILQGCNPIQAGENATHSPNYTS